VGKGSTFSFALKVKKGNKLIRQNVKNSQKILSLLTPGRSKEILNKTLRSIATGLTVAVSEDEIPKLINQYQWFVCSGSYFKKYYSKWENYLLENKVRVVVVDANLQHKYRTEIPESRFFRMSHPVSQLSLISLFSYASASKTTSIEQKPCKSYKILMAEDNMFNQAFQRTLLERQGHLVIMADNGKEAIEIFKSEDFDVIFLDLHMPEMDGLETTRFIRKSISSIPIIGMSANVTDNTRQNCFDAGMNWFLEKPMSGDSVVDVLNNIQK
jgi:CheY-like chemotaxis protein